MIKRLIPDLHSLPAQMVAISVGLVLLMAVATGVPAVWLLRDQFDRQAMSQLDQASRAAEALYSAQQTELDNLALLVAERPTLRQLMIDDGAGQLAGYLATLASNATLNAICVCDATGRELASAGPGSVATGCDELAGGFAFDQAGGDRQVWHVAGHSVASQDGAVLGRVVVGLALDDSFAERIRAETGLEHTLLVAGLPVASSLPGRLSAVPTPVEGRFQLLGRPYYAAQFALGEEEGKPLAGEVALDVGGLVAAQQRLIGSWAGGVVAVAALASVLATLLARRIGRPLAELAGAAASLSVGQPTRPLRVETGVREVGLVVDALESARADLERTLGELRSEKAWTDHLLEAIVEGIVTLDRQGRITFFSQGAERITGWHRDEVLGRPCDEVFEPAETDEDFSQLIPPPGQRRKIAIRLHDGRQAVLAITGARLVPPVSEPSRVALVFRDVSEEEAFRRLLAHFLANVAHEFRTPLSAQAAAVELLMDQAPDLSPTEIQELLTALHLGVLGLQTLVDNLLESASIEAGRFRVAPRPAGLDGIIAEAIRTIQPLLVKHAQRLVIELPAALPTVLADPRRVGQVLINLLSNASKYGPDEGEITIAVALEGGQARVSVADQGPGVPVEYRADLFRRFAYRAGGDDRTRYGIGLGLSVVKAVVEAHNGRVGIEDRPGGGSIFWFTLPLEGARTSG
jgi:PAS domain S-box-containing protein